MVLNWKLFQLSITTESLHPLLLLSMPEILWDNSDSAQNMNAEVTCWSIRTKVWNVKSSLLKNDSSGSCAITFNALRQHILSLKVIFGCKKCEVCQEKYMFGWASCQFGWAKTYTGLPMPLCLVHILSSSTVVYQCLYIHSQSKEYVYLELFGFMY